MTDVQLGLAIGNDINTFFANAKRTITMNLADRTNYLNQLGKKYGVSQLSMDKVPMYNVLMNHLKRKIEKQPINVSYEMKKLPFSKEYKDETVQWKNLKENNGKSFISGKKLQKIADVAGDIVLDAKDALLELLEAYDGLIPMSSVTEILDMYDLSWDDVTGDYEQPNNEFDIENDAFNREQGLIESEDGPEGFDEDGYDNTPSCRGCEVKNWEVEERFDAYNLSTGMWCEKCYNSSKYPYRKDNYYDPSYAGERMDMDESVKGNKIIKEGRKTSESFYVEVKNNIENSPVVRFIVSSSDYSKLEKLENIGGFNRFSIDIIEETTGRTNTKQLIDFLSTVFIKQDLEKILKLFKLQKEGLKESTIAVKEIAPYSGFYSDPNGDKYYTDARKNIYTQVGGVWHICTKSGEADYPIHDKIIIQENKMKNKKLTESKKVLKETSHEIPSPKYMINYKEQDVVTAIKEAFKKYEDATCLKIAAVGDSQFYNVEVEMDTIDEGQDLEGKRFVLAQQIHKIRMKLFADLSGILPVVGINMANYEFLKNSEKIKFNLTILMSQTNQRDWVSGAYQQRDKSAAKKLDKALSDKEKVNEATNYSYELHYSDGVRGVIKGSNINSLVSKIAAKPNVKEWAVYKAGTGFHSTADEKFLVEWWGDGSYWDNLSKENSDLLRKKTRYQMPNQMNESLIIKNRNSRLNRTIVIEANYKLGDSLIHVKDVKDGFVQTMVNKNGKSSAKNFSINDFEQAVLSGQMKEVK